ncbi:MAG: cell division FtsA domain-containing protein [bacterium]|nr:cell division FtsA domain-containing protein [bacterium]
MRGRIITGIDIGTANIRIVVCELARGENTPRILTAVSEEAHGLKHGYITNAEEVVQSIRRAKNTAESAIGMRIKTAYLAIGTLTLSSTTTTGSIAISRPDGEITETDVSRAHLDAEQKIEGLANMRIIQSVPLEYKVGGQVVPGRPHGMVGAGLEAKILFIHALEQHIEDLIKSVEQAGIAVHDVVSAPLAESMVLLSRLQKNAGSMLVNIGAETLEMVVFENNIPQLVHTFNVGSHEITKAIALSFKLPMDESEQMKKRPNTALYPQEDIADIIDTHTVDFFKLIDKKLKSINRSRLLPAGVVITGGGSRLHNIVSLAKETLSLPAEAAKDIQVFHEQDGKLEKGTIPPEWAIAYGSCLMGALNEPRPQKTAVANELIDTVRAFIRQFLP